MGQNHTLLVIVEASGDVPRRGLARRQHLAQVLQAEQGDSQVPAMRVVTPRGFSSAGTAGVSGRGQSPRSAGRLSVRMTPFPSSTRRTATAAGPGGGPVGAEQVRVQTRLGEEPEVGITPTLTGC